MNNYEYPMGADNSDAPWQQEEPEEETFQMSVCQTLSKSVPVESTDYNFEIVDGEKIIDTSDTNWEEEYHLNDHYLPSQLIALFKQYLEENLSIGINFKSLPYTNHIINECDSWIEDECAYVED